MTNPKSNPVRNARRARRGSTLIEVVMAGMLAALIASVVVGGITTVLGAEARSAQKLEGLEIANRLLLQYLDDKDAMPSEDLHIQPGRSDQPGAKDPGPEEEKQFQKGRGVYRWTLRKSPVQIVMPEQSVIEKPVEGPGSKAMEKLELLSVSVYAAVPDGAGGYSYGERICTLTRVYHPLSVIYRNPDKLVRLSSDPARMMEMMAALLDSGTTSRTTPSAGGGGAGAAGSAGSGGAGGARVPATGSGSSGAGRTSGGSKPAATGSGALFNGSRTTNSSQ